MFWTDLTPFWDFPDSNRCRHIGPRVPSAISRFCNGQPVDSTSLRTPTRYLFSKWTKSSFVKMESMRFEPGYSTVWNYCGRRLKRWSEMETLENLRFVSKNSFILQPTFEKQLFLFWTIISFLSTSSCRFFGDFFYLEIQ